MENILENKRVGRTVPGRNPMHPLPMFSLLSAVSPASLFSPLDYFDILLLGMILMVGNLLFFCIEKMWLEL